MTDKKQAFEAASIAVQLVSAIVHKLALPQCNMPQARVPEVQRESTTQEAASYIGAATKDGLLTMVAFTINCY